MCISYHSLDVLTLEVFHPPLISIDEEVGTTPRVGIVGRCAVCTVRENLWMC